MHSNHSFILRQESFWIAIHIYLVKQFKIESSDIFQILEYFQNFDIYFINRYLTVWGFTIVFPQVPSLKKIVRFSHSFVDSCIGTFCHHKKFTGRVLLWDNFISPRNNLFHTQRRFFLARNRSPKGPHLLRMVQPIRSPENPGTTVVSIGHLTPWHENPGYRTQVWDKCRIYFRTIVSFFNNFFFNTIPNKYSFSWSYFLFDSSVIIIYKQGKDCINPLGAAKFQLYEIDWTSLFRHFWQVHSKMQTTCKNTKIKLPMSKKIKTKNGNN